MKKLSIIILTLILSLTLVWCSNVKSDPNIDLKKDLDKKTFVWFVASWCPHCKEEMPVYEEFYKENKTKVNMQLINIDGKKLSWTWNYTIPQDISKPLTYEDITWEKCEYIPSFVIYDENKKIIEKQCWSKLTKEDLETKLLWKTTNTWSWEIITSQTWSDNLNTNTKKDMNFSQTAWFQNGDVWVIMTTSNWKIEIRLFKDKAPKTVANFLALAKKWYYTNTTFHRVIKNFMIQGWEPTATWMWGESIYGKEFEDEFSKDLSNLTGSLSMANAWKNTNWSQFFINQVTNTHLDNKHTVFGQVVTGMDNVNKIATVKVGSNDKPAKDVKIIKMEVVKFENWKLSPYDYNFDEDLKSFQETTKKQQEANKDRVAKIWDLVWVNYTLTDTDSKEKIDSSIDRGETFDFDLWTWAVLKWFNEAIVWMKIWDKKTIKLKAKDAYGEYSDKNLQTVPKNSLADFEKAWYKLEAWVKLPTQFGEIKIKKVTSDTVILDLNPPLAWKNLTFDIELVKFNK